MYTQGILLAIDNSNVDFNMVGPSSGVTLDTTDNSITVNSPGVYNITFSTTIDILENAVSNSIEFQLSINGNPDFVREIEFTPFGTGTIEIDTLSRTDQVELAQGDAIRIFIPIVTGRITYSNSSLVVTKVA